jgi:hypothetical protein
MFANPPTMMTISSLLVAAGTNGRTMSGASVWPTKMLAAVESVSAPLVPVVLAITHASPCTTHCKKPTWYSTAVSAEKKMIVGSTKNAK